VTGTLLFFLLKLFKITIAMTMVFSWEIHGVNGAFNWISTEFIPDFSKILTDQIHSFTLQKPLKKTIIIRKKQEYLTHIKKKFHQDVIYNWYLLWSQGALVFFGSQWQFPCVLWLTVINIFMFFHWRFFIFNNSLGHGIQQYHWNKMSTHHRSNYYWTLGLLGLNYGLVAIGYHSGYLKYCFLSLAITTAATFLFHYKYFQSYYRSIVHHKFISPQPKIIHNYHGLMMDATYQEKKLKKMFFRNKSLVFGKIFDFLPFKNKANNMFIFHFFMGPWLMYGVFFLSRWFNSILLPQDIHQHWIIYCSIHGMALWFFCQGQPHPLKTTSHHKKFYNFTNFFNKFLIQIYRRLKFLFILVNLYWIIIIIFTQFKQYNIKIFQQDKTTKDIFNSFSIYGFYGLLPQGIYLTMVIFHYKKFKNHLNCIKFNV
jgi:hypothetical protein